MELSPVVKIVPRTIMVRWSESARCGFGEMPVIGVEAFPPHRHPAGSIIAPELWLVRILTGRGSRNYGFAGAWIGSDLRMRVALSPGQERDEVVMSWEDGKE